MALKEAERNFTLTCPECDSHNYAFLTVMWQEGDDEPDMISCGDCGHCGTMQEFAQEVDDEASEE